MTGFSYKYSPGSRQSVQLCAAHERAPTPASLCTGYRRPGWRSAGEAGGSAHNPDTPAPVAVAPTAAYDLIVLGSGRYAGVTRAVRAPSAPTEGWLRSRGRRQLVALSAALGSADGNPG